MNDEKLEIPPRLRKILRVDFQLTLLEIESLEVADDNIEFPCQECIELGILRNADAGCGILCDDHAFQAKVDSGEFLLPSEGVV